MGHVLDNSYNRATEGNAIISYASGNDDATRDNRLWRISFYEDRQKPIEEGVKAEQAIDYALTYNRTTGRVRFLAGDVSQLTFQAQVYDLRGRLVAHFMANEGYDASVLPAGTYVVSWNFAGRRHSGKFMKR